MILRLLLLLFLLPVAFASFKTSEKYITNPYLTLYNITNIHPDFCIGRTFGCQIYYKSVQDFLKSNGLKNDNWSVSFEEKLLYPYYIGTLYPIKVSLFKKMVIGEPNPIILPLQNASDVDFEYEENILLCHKKFCLVPENRLLAVTDKVQVSMDSKTLKYKNHIIFANNEKCLRELERLLAKGYFLALAMKIADVEVGNCSFKGSGNFFSQIINPSKASNYVYYSNGNYVCYNPVFGEKVKCNGTEKVLFYDYVKKRFTYGTLKEARTTDSIIYFNNKVLVNFHSLSYIQVYWLNPFSGNKRKIIVKGREVFSYPILDAVFLSINDERKKIDTKKNIIFYYPFIKDSLIFNETERVLHDCKIDTATTKVVCDEGSFDLLSLIKNFLYFNNTLYLYFKATLESESNGIYNGVKPYVEVKPLIVYVKKERTLLSFNESSNFIEYLEKTIYFTKDKLLNELFKVYREKTEMKREKIKVDVIENSTFYRDVLVKIYHFPRVKGIITIENKTIDLSSVSTLKVKEVNDLKLDVIVFVLLNALFIAFYFVDRKLGMSEKYLRELKKF